MSIKARVALLLGVLLVTFLCALQLIRVVERDRTAQLHRESLQANKLVIQRWIDLTNQPLRRFAQDYAQWPELADFAAKPDARWAEANLRQNLAGYSAHALWVFDAAGRLVYQAQEIPGPALPPPAGVPAWADRPGRLPGDSFFVESRLGLLEVWCLPIIRNGDSGQRSGHLALSRLWGNDYLDTLRRLTDARLVLAPAGLAEPAVESAPGASIALPDAAGQPLRHLQLRPPDPDFSESLARDAAAAYLFAGFGVLMVTALWLAVRQWVLQPLDRIGESLVQGNPAAIQFLRQDRTELGRIAQLIESSFTQKAVLERVIAEHKQTEAALRESEIQVRHSLDLRARLARDLHDGVIQSIYAAGLGLESAIMQLEKDPAGASLRLQLCRQSLNETIREVRGFINGIEPEDLRQRGFDQELTVLARTMQAFWPVAISIEIAPSVVPLLSAIQELHALQIIRESISNAVRHGGARQIRILLRESDGQGSLVVRDDGRGFDSTARRGAGSGLGNIETRAREMGGSLNLDSQPGLGTTVTVSFPLNTPSP